MVFSASGTSRDAVVPLHRVSGCGMVILVGRCPRRVILGSIERGCDMTVRTSTIIHEGAMYALLAGVFAASVVGAKVVADVVVSLGSIALS